MNKKKIAIITSGHSPFDERIYWKFALSLSNNNFSVKIICSTQEINKNDQAISVIGFSDKNLNKWNKIHKFIQMLNSFSPEIIICSEPLTILPAFFFKIFSNRKCKIISDVTEWYPENVAFKFSGAKKYFIYSLLFLLNIFLTNLAGALIIGEITKKRRYDFISPLKKKIIIGYYPVLNFFKYTPPNFNGNVLTLCYAGLVNFDRGILQLLEVAKSLSERHNGIKIKVKILGNFSNDNEEKIFNELIPNYPEIIIEKMKRTDYRNISQLINDADICFDLRIKNFIYDNSLPIKIFEYMACGKPFIFSDIKPIRKELGKINCGFLVNPIDKQDIINKIDLYLSNKELLLQQSKNGRNIIENGKNWEKESAKLIYFLNQLSNPKQLN
ncbi:MAG: glycosyltransferase [Bacteroidetes bacterium]|nr:glycosyltransferase [Bacteroidota bacterium]